MLLAMLGVVMSNSGSRHSYNVPEVSLDQAKVLIDSGAIVIDVRAAEQGLAHIPGAHMIPLEVLSASLARSTRGAARPVIVSQQRQHARAGSRAHPPRPASPAVNLKPGFSGWRDAGLPVERG
jgi:rhodanese-related sulfurtransferase